MKNPKSPEDKLWILRILFNIHNLFIFLKNFENRKNLPKYGLRKPVRIQEEFSLEKIFKGKWLQKSFLTKNLLLRVRKNQLRMTIETSKKQ